MEENRVKGPPPFFRRRVLTLSLEGKELRLLSSWGGSVGFWGSLPLPPGRGALPRPRPRPLRRGGDRGEVVPREARRHLGVTPEGHRLFWQTLPGKGLQRVLVAAVPQEGLHTLLGAFSVAGLTLGGAGPQAPGP